MAFLLDVRSVAISWTHMSSTMFRRRASFPVLSWLTPSIGATQPARLSARRYLPLMIMMARYGRPDENNQPRNMSVNVNMATKIVILHVLTNRSVLSARTIRNTGDIVTSLVMCFQGCPLISLA